uniref:DMT family transporter n=1 Tax=Pararhizobium sp. IMCC3301 TaxID=3067904 RepID=UPI00274293DB|nr:DMT family transporter [Pararhizobium sp. IMCC3301]
MSVGSPGANLRGGNAMLAAIFMLVGAVILAFDAVLVRLLAQQVHPFVIVFFRSVFGLMIVLPWIVARRHEMTSHYRVMHFLRAAMKIAALACFFFAFALAPLADVTAIMFTAPIFLTLGGWLIFGEKYSMARLIAVLAGFVGVIIVISPAGGDMSWALAYALIGSALTAAIQLMLKKMARHDSTQTLVSWNLVLMVPLAFIPALYFWTTPTLPQLGLLAVQGILGALNMSLVTRALSMADASLLAPLDFVRLPVVAIFAFLFFDELASVETWIGASVIFLSTLIVAGGAGWKRRK